MFKLIFTNSRNELIEIFGPPFRLIRVEGLGGVEAAIQTQKAPFQDGSTFVDSVLQERAIEIELKITGSTQEELAANRQKVASIFNPKLGEGLLHYIGVDGVKQIGAISDSVPFFPDGKGNRSAISQKTVINLFAPNPYWTTEDIVDQLVVWEGGLEFPLQLPTEFARQSESKTKILLNEGDVETPVFITFNGPATSPIKIINKTTGEFIEVNQSLLAGERLEINTAFGQKRVTKILVDGSRQNAFHFITVDSTFFNLVQGNNLIDYSTGADYEMAGGVMITWRNRYLAV